MAYKKVDGKEVLEVAIVSNSPTEGSATVEKQEEQIVVAEEQLEEAQDQTTALQDIEGGIPESLGQKAMAASMPVAIASDQTTLPISAASLPLPVGAATEATLSAQSAKLPATLGQKAMAASLAVSIASDQSSVPANLSGGSFSPTQVDIAITATQVLSSPLANRKSLLIQNNDTANPVYVGTSSGVTATNGWKIGAGQSQGFPFNASVTSIYLISTGGTVRVGLMEIT